MIATMYGNFGDILWSLATVRELAKEYGPIDLRIGEAFGSIIPFLEFQPSIASAAIVPDWKHCRMPPPGAWPDDTKHLGNCLYVKIKFAEETPLVDVIAQGVDVQIREHGRFLTAPAAVPLHSFVTTGFGANYPDRMALTGMVHDMLWDGNVPVIDLTPLPWLDAARTVSIATVHVGNRSALNVLAHGLGRPVVAYERFEACREILYSYPYGQEFLTDDLDTALNAIRERIPR